MKYAVYDLPDIRKPGNNTKYQIEDAVISALSVFFTQSPSFLELKRWLRKNPKNKYGSRVTLLGDDLYSHQPICELALKQDYNLIFVCLKSSHQTLYEWLDFLDNNGEVKTVEKKKWDGRKNLIYRYRYASRLPSQHQTNSRTAINFIQSNDISTQADLPTLIRRKQN